MANKNIITTFLSVFLIVGVLFLATPKDANAGAGPPAGPGCCQILTNDGFICSNTMNLCVIPVGSELIGFFEGSSCDFQTGFCSDFEPSDFRDVPTLSEWGLIAMAGVLGVVGFMVMRRKRATA